MKKATITIRTPKGIANIEGYICNGLGVHRVNGDAKGSWTITDLATGMGVSRQTYKTRKDAENGIDDAKRALEDYITRRPECYADYVSGFNKLTGKAVNTKANTESEGKKMAKTNTKTTKANTTAPKRTNYKKQNEELKREIEILKKQIEGLTKVEKTNIDSFDVEAYMASRDNTNRITEALVEALKNTDGLVVTRKGSDEWLYVSGKTADDTKSRKDIFKAMGFRWSGKESAWFLAPYPLANGKRWASKKASKASANA